MTNLSDKLKSLGVKVGAKDLAPPQARNTYPIEQVLSGRLLESSAGEAYIVETVYPPDHLHGHTGLIISASLAAIAEWADERRILSYPPSSFYFLDCETTGLAGGTGTYAFLVGIGCFTDDGFRLTQFFMRDLTEEPAQLLALEEFLAPCRVLVTFNGKAFDIPLLTTRYIVQGWHSPLASVAQLDLLHLARRLWRERFPSRTLGTLETHILGARRTLEDIPGWMIPQMYFDYLHSGDARPLTNVFYHNSMDVLALAALLNHATHLLEDPLHGTVEHYLDQYAIGRLFEDLGRWDEAVELYRRSLDDEAKYDPAVRDKLIEDILRRLSFLHKRRGELSMAVDLWKQAAQRQHLYAYIELAKYYEHDQRDYNEAIHWTQSALELVSAPGLARFERLQWQPDLDHRLARLYKKAGQADE